MSDRASTAQEEFSRLTNAYNAAARVAGPERIAAVLAEPIPEGVRRNPELHSQIRHFRGNMLCRIGLNDAAETEYGLGFYEAPVAEKADYLLDWAMAAFGKMFLEISDEEKAAGAARCFSILDLATGFAGELPEPHYLLASCDSVRGFLCVRARDSSAARGWLSRIDLPPLSPGFEDERRLASFFTQISKGLLAALDVSDSNLLRAIAESLLTGSERSALQEEQATVGETFVATVSVRMDVPKFRDGWWAILDFAHALFPAFPNTRRLRTLLRGGAPPGQVAAFVDSACGT